MSKKYKSVSKDIDDFWDHWIERYKLVTNSLNEKKYNFLSDLVNLYGNHEGGNFIDRDGYLILLRAAENLCIIEGVMRRLSVVTVQKFLINQFFDEVRRIKEGKKVFSGDAVVERAKLDIRAIPSSDDIYVFPVLFASKAKDTDFKIGPARLISKERFIEINKINFEKVTDKEDFGIKFFEKWECYNIRYDHFLTVSMRDFENEMAWKIGREVAEFFLNLVRMVFGYQQCKHIKLGGGFIWEESTTNMAISGNGDIFFSSCSGPWGSHLDERWTIHFDERLGGMAKVLSSLCSWLASGERAGSPVLERQRYAHQLLSEAYCEPHDHIRLVRLVAALEALAVLERNDKAEALANSCAKIGAFGDRNVETKIYNAIIAAYKIRNKVVHGDGASVNEITEVFYGVEQYILEIFEGYTLAYVEIWNAKKPQSIRSLRKSLKMRVDGHLV